MAEFVALAPNPITPEKKNLPEEVTTESNAVEVPLPPKSPNIACPSAPLVNPPPGQPTQVVTVSVPIVELGERSSEDDATPVEDIVKRLIPVDEEIVRKLAV